MNLAEKLVKAYQNNEPMPLKGHTKITLTDVKTGEKQVIEKDNMVTNAVSEILSKNWCGLAQYHQIMPLKNLFSGVLCFEGEVTESANNYNPPNDNVNQLVCHAGPDAHSTGEATRGQPNVAEWDVQDTYIKYVWDFTTSVQGEIRTVCLCPATLGDMGLKPYDTTYHPLQSFGDNRSTGTTSWDVDKAKTFPFTIASDGKSCKSVYANSTTFTEYSIRHDFFAFGIMRDPTTWQVTATRTATLTNAFDNKSFIWDDNDYYYVGKATTSTKLVYDKIKKSDMSVTNVEYTVTGLTLYTGSMDSNNARNFCMRTYAYDGTYLYMPNGDGNKFVKLNLGNASDVAELPETLTIHKGSQPGGSSQGEQFISPIVISAGLIVGDNYVINYGHAYQVKQAQQIGGATGASSNGRFADIIKVGAGTYGNAWTNVNYAQAGQSAILNSMVLTTINVLDNVVNKTSSTTMKIEYTLTEV